MQSPILDRVRKLLAKTTEANCTQAEADSAFATATRLLAEHNLSMADVSRSTSVTDEIYVEEFTFRTGRWSVQHNLAYSIVEEFCFVKGLFNMSRGNQRRVRELYLFGLRENVESAKFMFASLLSSFDGLFQSYRARTLCNVKEKYAFTSGVADGFRDKMRAETRKVTIEQDTSHTLKSGSTEIVLRSVVEKTEKLFEKRHPNLRKESINFGASYGSGSSRAAGYREGQNLNLRRGLK